TSAGRASPSSANTPPAPAPSSPRASPSSSGRRPAAPSSSRPGSRPAPASSPRARAPSPRATASASSSRARPTTSRRAPRPASASSGSPDSWRVRRDGSFTCHAPRSPASPMKITDLAINNRVAVVVLTVLLSLIGLLAYASIPKESSPQIEFATIVVTTIYPGASPDDIESIITQEVEREVATINGIDELRSTSTEGVSTVVITFTPDVDVSEAKTEVRDAVDRAKAEFPTDVEEPIKIGR